MLFIRVLTCSACLLFLSLALLCAGQGEDSKVYEIKDSAYIFKPVKPITTYQAKKGQISDAWGIDLLFSDHGFGLGTFYQKYFNDKMLGFVSLYASGAHNTDEFESWDPVKGEWVVPNKINRIYMFPTMCGVQYFVLKDKLAESFRPFVSAGAGPTLIVATPYSKDWFESFNYAKSYMRFGGFIGLGSYFGSLVGPLIGVNARYYYIPFGGKGLESIKDYPIKNFGGVFLSLSLGTSW